MNKHIFSLWKDIIKRKGLIMLFLIVVIIVLYGLSLRFSYYRQFGDAILDRNNRLVSVIPNGFDESAHEINVIPDILIQKIINQEDQQFYYHPGFNPYRIAKGFVPWVNGDGAHAVSTLPEQLVKNILRTNNNRNLYSKLIEITGSILLSGLYDKDEIMRMYVNSVPMGRGIVGMGTASYYYFNKPLSLLRNDEMNALLVTLKNPNSKNPYMMSGRDSDGEKKLQVHPLRSVYYPELLPECKNIKKCNTTIDKKVEDGVRAAAKEVTTNLFKDGAENAAVIVFDVKNKNILAIVGTPKPTLPQSGYQIDMSREYRAIGSTIKPFIYGLAFEMGVNGETIIDDSPIHINLPSGFTMYPKNFDGKYRGKVTVREALSQSLNIPAARMLQYVGLVSFYEWLEKKVGVVLLQRGIDYGSSTALGALELTPIQLGYLFTIFPQAGKIMPYNLIEGTPWTPKGVPLNMIAEKEVMRPEVTRAITDILSNRNLGVEQFGVNSNLQLGISNYALKTGTSKKYHDSWVVGYTPEIVCVVWVGNARHDPMNEITGQKGAGELWEKVTNILIAHNYITDIPFKPISNSVSNNNTVSEIQNNTMFVFPQNGDVLSVKRGESIEIETTEIGEFTIDGKHYGIVKNIQFTPHHNGIYTINFRNKNHNETIKISVLLTQ